MEVKLTNMATGSVHKSGRGRGSSTSFTITKTGRIAYHLHREALSALLGAQLSESEEA